jgi:hypothetical protein
MDGVTMTKNRAQENQKARFRLDLTARLFLPHGPLFRRARTASRPSELSKHPAATSAPSDTAQPSLDIICAGMYRACSTWQYEVAAHLIDGARNGQRLGYLTSQQYMRLIKADVRNDGKDPEARRAWRVIKSHEGNRYFSAALADGQARAIYAFRDVRDVVFSLMHKRGKSFEQLLRQGMIHQILANDRFWVAQPNVLIQRYEDLLADPAGGVQELARHLGIPLTETEATRIANEYSHEANRARADALRRRLHDAGVNLDSPTNLQICDPTTLLHWNHMRSGSAGSWRFSATPGQRKILERLCGPWLEAHGYPLDAIDKRFTAFSRRGLRERVREEADLWTGRATMLIRTATERFPRTARAAKRLLGLPAESSVGASVWSDPVPAIPASRSQEQQDGSPAPMAMIAK